MRKFCLSREDPNRRAEVFGRFSDDGKKEEKDGNDDAGRIEWRE